MVPAKDRNDEADVLVGRVYDVAVGLGSWHEVLRSTAGMFRGSAALLNIVGRHRSAALPVGAIVTDGDPLPRAEFLRTSFCDDCFRPRGLMALMNLRAPRGKDGTVANLCVVRSARHGDFDRADVAAFARLAPHLLRTVAVHVRLAAAEGERRALAETFEHLPRAAFLVDVAEGPRSQLSGAALLAARDGLRADRARAGACARPERMKPPPSGAPWRRRRADARGARRPEGTSAFPARLPNRRSWSPPCPWAPAGWPRPGLLPPRSRC